MKRRSAESRRLERGVGQRDPATVRMPWLTDACAGIAANLYFVSATERG
jgi:hypothetical protein